MALNVQQNYLEKSVDNEKFLNGEQVEGKTKKIAEDLEGDQEKKHNFVSRIREMLGFSEKPEAGDMGKTNETKNLNEEEENDIKDEQGGAKLNTDVEKRGE